MAEINFNNLYNQLSPMDKMFYDQQFQKSYNPNQENIMLSSQNAYEQMKSVYDAQQQVPEKSFFDSLNLFGSASAAEKPTVPNLSLGYNMPTFDLGTGITNTTAASPFKIGLSDTLTQYNVPGLRSQNLQEDLVQQIIAENQARTNPFARPNMFDIAGGITNIDLIEENELPYSGVGNMRYMTPRTIADQNKILGQTFTEQKPSGIEKLLQYLPFGEKSLLGFLADKILPKESPQMKAAKSFYRDQYGLDSAGRVASGIMKKRNPVSGGLLNMITGGKYGKPSNIGLQRAYQQDINRIKKTLAKKYADGDYSGTQLDEKLAELQRLKTAEQMAMERPTIDKARAAASNVYSGANKALGPGGGFSTSGREGAFSSKSGRGRQDF
jgi:hypothetical protein